MTEALSTAIQEGSSDNGMGSLESDISSPTSLKENSQVTEDHDADGGYVFGKNIGQSYMCEEVAVLADVCRVCQCSEPDKSGEAALKFLGISVPSHAVHQNPNGLTLDPAAGATSADGKDKLPTEDNTSNGPASLAKHHACTFDLEVGPSIHADSLMDLGCACRSDLAVAHYACALRWFVSRGSMICEICGVPAVNVSIVDRNKILCVLKEKNTSEHPHHGVPVVGTGETDFIRSPLTDHSVPCVVSNNSVDLVQVTAWFDPLGNSTSGLPTRTLSEQMVDIPDEGSITSVSPTTKWAVEGTGILIATGLLTVTITWLLSPRVDKGVARRGLNVLLGGLCALSIVVFLRFGVLPRIKYGPARYWAILVVFWFLVFGVWASTTRSSRSST